MSATTGSLEDAWRRERYLIQHFEARQNKLRIARAVMGLTAKRPFIKKDYEIAICKRNLLTN